MGFAIFLEMKRCPEGVEIYDPPKRLPPKPLPPSPPPEDESSDDGLDDVGILGRGWRGGALSGAHSGLLDPEPLARWFSPEGWQVIPGGVVPAPHKALPLHAPPPMPQLPTLSPELEAALYGPHVRYKTLEREAFRKPLDLLEKPLVETFVNCDTRPKLINFMSKYGIPAWGGKYRDEADNSLALIEMFRDAVSRVLGQYAGGEVAKASAVLRADRDFADLRPVLSFPRDTTTPVLTFKVFAMLPFMCLEIGSIIAGGTTVKTCLNCGQVFVVGPSTNRRTTAHYCSNRCRVAHQRKRTIEREAKRSTRARSA